MSVRILVSYTCDMCGANEQYVVTGYNARHPDKIYGFPNHPDGWSWTSSLGGSIDDITDICSSCAYTALHAE